MAALFALKADRETANTDLMRNAAPIDPLSGTALTPSEAQNASEVWKLTGGARDEDAEKMRILALTNPAQYSQAKAAAISAIKFVVETAYH
jgi:hypothetical protein